MAQWPARGESPWGDKLKAYIDGASTTDSFWISPAQFGPMAGMALSLNALNANWIVYLNIQNGNHRRSSIPAPPPGWNTMDIELFWSVPTDEAGNITLSIDTHPLTVGEGASNNSNALTFDAPEVANILQKTTLATGIEARSELCMYQLRYAAGSSYPNSVHVLGLRYVRTS